MSMARGSRASSAPPARPRPPQAPQGVPLPRRSQGLPPLCSQGAPGGPPQQVRVCSAAAPAGFSPAPMALAAAPCGGKGGPAQPRPRPLRPRPQPLVDLVRAQPGRSLAPTPASTTPSPPQPCLEPSPSPAGWLPGAVLRLAPALQGPRLHGRARRREHTWRPGRLRPRIQRRGREGRGREGRGRRGAADSPLGCAPSSAAAPGPAAASAPGRRPQPRPARAERCGGPPGDRPLGCCQGRGPQGAGPRLGAGGGPEALRRHPALHVVGQEHLLGQGELRRRGRNGGGGGGHAGAHQEAHVQQAPEVQAVGVPERSRPPQTRPPRAEWRAPRALPLSSAAAARDVPAAGATRRACRPAPRLLRPLLPSPLQGCPPFPSASAPSSLPCLAAPSPSSSSSSSPASSCVTLAAPAPPSRARLPPGDAEAGWRGAGGHRRAAEHLHGTGHVQHGRAQLRQLRMQPKEGIRSLGHAGVVVGQGRAHVPAPVQNGELPHQRTRPRHTACRGRPRET